MDGMYQDMIIMLTILFFGFWVIKGHYDNVWKIEQLEIEIKKARKKELSSYPKGISLNDLKKMQTDIIKLQQNCINIDAKYKIKDEWMVDRIKQLTDIVHCRLQEAVNTHNEVKELYNSYEEGAGIASSGSVTMSEAADMESEDV